jgi:hypothetical protein
MRQLRDETDAELQANITGDNEQASVRDLAASLPSEWP